jgi:hypothetical protein
VTEVSFYGDEITATTTFGDTKPLSIDIPEKRHPFHIGAMVDDKLHGSLYGQYDFKLKDHILLPVRVEYDGQFKYKAGIEFNP